MPSAAQIHEMVSHGDKRVEAVCRVLSLLSPVASRNPLSFDQLVKRKHKLSGAVLHPSGKWSYHTLRYLPI